MVTPLKATVVTDNDGDSLDYCPDCDNDLTDVLLVTDCALCTIYRDLLKANDEVEASEPYLFLAASDIGLLQSQVNEMVASGYELWDATAGYDYEQVDYSGRGAPRYLAVLRLEQYSRPAHCEAVTRRAQLQHDWDARLACYEKPNH